MLVGEAKSNVHDGDKDLGDNFILKGIEKQSDIGFLTFFEYFEYFIVGQNLKCPRLPIWIVQSESHYSIFFSVDNNMVKPNPGVQKFDLVYYDELAKQEDDIILTVEFGKQGETQKRKNPIPIEEVIRTKWKNSIVSWNGRTAIL